MPQSPPRDESPHLSPDAALIQRLRTDRGLEGPLSVARCAEMLGTYTTKPFTDRSWSAYEQGKRAIPDREYVLMALVVGATPEDVKEAGRESASQLLRQEIDRRRSPTVSGASRTTTERIDQAIAEIQALPFSPETREGMVAVLLQQVNALLDLHKQQVQIMRREAP
jgi:transcriptional regulator with XRE-family HTH domain